LKVVKPGSLESGFSFFVSEKPVLLFLIKQIHAVNVNFNLKIIFV